MILFFLIATSTITTPDTALGEELTPEEYAELYEEETIEFEDEDEQMASIDDEEFE